MPFSTRRTRVRGQRARSRDPERRREIFVEIQEILAQDVPYVPLWQTIDYAFAQNDIQGVTINPSQNFPFWTIEK